MQRVLQKGEKEIKHTIQELREKQGLPLSMKIKMTEHRIREFVRKYDIGGVYVSFSGGKDSTVLLDIARHLYPEMLAVYVDTGLEYPEVRNFVKTYDNVEWLKPKKNFRQVIEEYGYPFISKEVSNKVSGARRYVKAVRERESRRPIPYSPFMADLVGIDRRINKENQDYQNIKMGITPRQNSRYAQGVGTYLSKDGKPSAYNVSKYKFFLEAPFEISANCCNVMKKYPVHSFGRKTGRKPITAQMASESRLRTSQWLKNGCNGFEMKSPISNPMSFWTEQDVLLYIKEHKLPIASVYGEIKVEDDGTLKTTGCDRTGCMFCGYGCHLEKPGEGRFLRMKETHPKQYDYIMRPKEQGGLNYKEIIDWINERGGFHIEY
jgi:3'-phosphoadenosine 5'-phosphosulfate sulfotransferase (PAPS reductase)/FAD synthetase